MATKKKKDKKNKNKSFTKMLKQHCEDIKVLTADGEETLKHVTEDSVNGITATTTEGVIPVDVNEAMENSVASTEMVMTTSFAKASYSTYEFALKYKSTKQTMLLYLEADDMDFFLDGKIPMLDGLNEKSNIGLVMNKMPAKIQNRLSAWSEMDDGEELFILRIPDLIFFYGQIKSGEVALSRRFDLVVQFIKTEKGLQKLAKNNKRAFSECMDQMVASSVEVLQAYGASCVHLAVDDTIFGIGTNCAEYADVWCKNLMKNNEKSLLKRVVFCAADSITLSTFGGQLIKFVTGKDGFSFI